MGEFLFCQKKFKTYLLNVIENRIVVAKKRFWSFRSKQSNVQKKKKPPQLISAAWEFQQKYLRNFFYRCPIWQYILNNNFFMVEKVNKLTSYCQIGLLINSTINHLKRSNFGTVVVLGAASAFVSFELFIGVYWLCVSVRPNCGRCIHSTSKHSVSNRIMLGSFIAFQLDERIKRDKQTERETDFLRNFLVKNNESQFRQMSGSTSNRVLQHCIHINLQEILHGNCIIVYLSGGASKFFNARQQLLVMCDLSSTQMQK